MAESGSAGTATTGSLRADVRPVAIPADVVRRRTGTGVGGMDGALSHLSRACRAAWWAVATVMTVTGTATSWFVLGPVRALLIVGTLGTAVTLGCWQLGHGRPRPTGRDIARGAVAGTAVLAVAGLMVEFGAAGWWSSVLVACAGWWVVPHAMFHPGLSPRPARRPPPGTGRLIPDRGPAIESLPVMPLPALSTLSTLSTPDLCRAWRVSYGRIHRCTCASRLDHLAELRGGYLDELQRRDPSAFARWFPTARAASDPGRFFCPRPTGSASNSAQASVGRQSAPPPVPPPPDGTSAQRRRRASHGGPWESHSTDGTARDGRAARRPSSSSARADAGSSPTSRPDLSTPRGQLDERNPVDESDQ